MIPPVNTNDPFTASAQTITPVPYRKKFTRSYCGWLGLRLIPYFWRHFVHRPYFRDIPEIGYEFPKERKDRRLRIALYGAMYNVLLDGYQALAGSRLKAETGQFIFLVIDMTKKLDEYLDNQLDLQHIPELQEALDTPSIRSKIDLLRRYVEMQHCAEPVFDYLNSMFRNYYNNYVTSLAHARGANDFGAALKAAQIDTGIWLRAMMDLVAIFNGLAMNADAHEEFYWLGMVGKFADDMVDISRDVAQQRLNLIHMLIQQQNDELPHLYSAFENKVRLNARWWNDHCPKTFNRYFEFIDSYYHHIKNEQLRFACDLIVLPTLLGRDYDHGRSQ